MSAKSKHSVSSSSPPLRLYEWAWGACAAFTAAVCLAWSAASCRNSGDTWLGLAAGRLIRERGYGNFPLTDEFSFSFAGKVWTNQNWLSHVISSWVYDRLCPSALVGTKLLVSALIGLSIWKCACLLSRDRVLSVLTASASLVCITAFIDMRPNLMGFLCAAALSWMLLHVKYGRGWPLWIVVPVMTFWGSAHGSFLLGFGLIGVFLSGELLQRFLGCRTTLSSPRRLVALGLTTIASVVLIVLTSPYHLHNFTHPLVIMVGSDKAVFQEIWEWKPPHTLFEHKDQVVGYWLLVAVGILSVSIAGARRSSPVRMRGDEPPSPAAFDWTEILLAGVGLYFSLNHLRFIPLFVILGMPVITKWISIALRGDGSERTARRVPRLASPAWLIGNALAGLILAGYVLGFRGDELKQAFVPEPANDEPYRTWLFHRHLRHELDPVEMVDFANQCRLTGRILNEWSWGGYLMFHAPALKLYIDGRAQALYDAAHCDEYFNFRVEPLQEGDTIETQGKRLDRKLTRMEINLVLGKRNVEWSNRIIEPLLSTENWHPLFESEEGILIVNGVSDDPHIRELMHKYWAGRIQWPDTAFGWRIRAYYWQNCPEPNLQRALAAYGKAVLLLPEAMIYERMASWSETGKPQDVISYFRSERNRVGRLVENAPPERIKIYQECVVTLDRIIADLESKLQ